MAPLCKIGVHEWKWKYVQEGSCNEQEICIRCGKSIGQIKARHQWNIAYTSANSCEMQETCVRCGIPNGPINTVHEWEWVDLSPCAKKESCKRCGAIREVITKEHHWIRSYIRADSCETQETCTNCGAARGPINVLHEWDWQYLNSFVKQEVCKRCKHGSGKTDSTGQRLWSQIYSDADRRAKYLSFQKLLSNLAQVSKFCFITNEEKAWNTLWDTKRTGGATALVTREPAKIVQELLPYTNIIIFGILFQAKYLFFLPDNVLVLKDRSLLSKESVLASSSYPNLKVNFSAANFGESGSVPSDSEVINYTWQHVRVDGGADLRYSRNPRIPIVRYGCIGLSLQAGWNLQFHSSNFDLANDVVKSLLAYIGLHTTPDHTTSSTSESRKSEPSKPASRSNLEGLTPYEVLGITPNASIDEITAAYRKLAQENHPDKVAGLAVEFRELAERRMKIINAAYEELKHTNT